MVIIKKLFEKNFMHNMKFFLISIFFLMFFIFLANALSGLVFLDNTNEEFGNGTLFQTNISGSGAGANVTLNFTKLTGNMSAGISVYNRTGNFTSRIFDSTQNHTVYDKIEWTRTLTNSSDILGYGCNRASRDCGTFYRNGTVAADLTQNDFATVVTYTEGRITYNIPSGFSYNDIIGFGWDDVGNILYAFFVNGSVVSGAASSLTADITLSTVGKFTIASNFNISNVIGMAMSGNTDVAMFFKNQSFLEAPTGTPPFAFTNVRSYTLAAGFNVSEVIGADFNRRGFDAALFFRNTSYVSDTAQTDFSTNVDFATAVSATYPSDVNLTTYTNITLQTRISNDSVTFTDWSGVYINNDGTQTIESANGRYIQYKAVFTTIDKYFTPILENVSINYTIDIYAPAVNSSINNTAPEFGEVINFTANISDTSGLSFCQFIDNLSTNGAKRFFNISIAGQNDKCSQNYTISRTRGNIINFSLIVNDTYNNKNQTDIIITVSGIPPRWQNPQINDTNVEQFDFVSFNATWTDNIGLSAYIFSINATGVWINVSNFSFYGITNLSNFTMQINASPNTIVGWVFYANDTSNNFNVTDVQTFVVVSQYHIFYGDITSNIILDTSENISIIAWFNSSNVKGNVYVADTDTLNGISWASLQAIGKDKLLNDIPDDWAKIDFLLNMTNFSDSINRTFLQNGAPKNKTDFVVNGKTIINVSTINSTNTSNFVTGILWDTSDSTDIQYDTTEKEDIVFATKVNNKALGSFGTYHYEIRAPARLQRYRVPNNYDSLSFYVELS